MKKNLVKTLLAGLVVFQLMGCGNSTGSEEGTESTTQAATEAVTEEATEEAEETVKVYLKDVNVDEYVTLGEYKGLEVTQTLQEITEEDVQNFIQYNLSGSSRTEAVTDRDVVEMGDIANIDYEGKKDGVAFDGGTATDYNLTIGSGTFIDGFEEGLVGAKVGETIELNLTFPENYRVEDMAGAAVVFTVTVNSISREVAPELNDEYVQGLGIENVSTVEEYRQYVRTYLEEQAMDTYKYNTQMELIGLVVENAQVTEVPEGLQQKYIDVIRNEIEYQAAYYGVDVETFLNMYFGIDLETYETEMAAGAAETAKQAMVCKKIAQIENLEVTQEDIDAVLEANYAGWGYTSVEQFKSMNDMEEYSDSLLIDKALEFLMDNAVITEEAVQTE